MAKENEDGQEKTEDPTDERREEFRKKGDIAVSRELTSVFVFAGSIAFMSFFFVKIGKDLEKILIGEFQLVRNFELTESSFVNHLTNIWIEFLKIITPIFLVTFVIALATTFMQTRLNVSFEKLKPNFQKMNPFKGIARLVGTQSLMELAKGIAKMIAIGTVSYLILKSEVNVVPGLINYDVIGTFKYWGKITGYLFWSVSSLLLLVAAADYFYNFITMENQMKMTKKEVKDEYKNREVDPHVKGRMRRMQREIINSKMIKSTESATALITNPTHFSIAIKYEVGMAAPIVVAKGVDFLALRMREVAKKNDITIVENRPLARTLYKLVEVGDEIPDSLYKAISEVIKYVFKLKGIKVTKKAEAK